MCLENSLNLPHVITLESMKQVASFAEGELSFLALQGSKSGNPGLPLTDQQKAQNEQKKKAAAAVAAGAFTGKGAGGKTSAKGKGAAEPENTGAVRLSTPTSTWARPCNFWQKGNCKRGINCHFKHEGIPVSDGRCYICGEKNHSLAQCSAPGGGADPDREKNWAAYRERRDKAKAEQASQQDNKGGKKGGMGR